MSFYEIKGEVIAQLKWFWDWFWYFRRGKVRYRVLDFGNTYNASASDGKVTVWNCYGGTPEAAKEMASYRLRQAYQKPN